MIRCSFHKPNEPESLSSVSLEIDFPLERPSFPWSFVYLVAMSVFLFFVLEVDIAPLAMAVMPAGFAHWAMVVDRGVQRSGYVLPATFVPFEDGERRIAQGVDRIGARTRLFSSRIFWGSVAVGVPTATHVAFLAREFSASVPLVVVMACAFFLSAILPLGRFAVFLFHAVRLSREAAFLAEALLGTAQVSSEEDAHRALRRALARQPRLDD